MNRTPPSKYQYRPLESERSIRLVRISPGSADDIINLTTQHRHLDSNEPTYEALSYTWGSTDNLKLIYINHFSFQVTPNLFEALQRLRLRDKHRTLWIDAICINQEDDLEKSTQLLLMRDIYPNASSVVVWIGQAEAVGEIEWAFQSMEILAALYMFWYETPKAATQRGLRSRLARYDLPRVFRILRRPWFERAWTFQEICLSANAEIICGPHSILWPRIVCAIAAARMGSDGAGLTGVQKSALARVEYWALLHVLGMSKTSKELSLTRLLAATKGLATTDARDRIYSLLGLANIRVDAFQPDYTVDLPPIYIRAARVLVAQDNNLDVFQQLDKPKPAGDLPSWVPDWRQSQRGASFVPQRGTDWIPDKSWKHKHRDNSFIDSNNGKFYNFNLAYIPDFSDRPLSDKPRLLLTGACFDIVESICSVTRLASRLHKLNAKAQVSWRDIFVEIQRFYTTLRLPRQYEPTEELSPRAFLRTLCADRLPIALQRENLEDLIPEQIGHYKRNTGSAMLRSSRGTFIYDAAWITDMYDRMWAECGNEITTPSNLDITITKTITILKMVVGIDKKEEDNEKRIRIAREYCSMLAGILDGRTFVKTHNGYVGLGPVDCLPGDQIFSLLGGDMPYMLRLTSRQDEYRIFGAAYIHGVMDGELWNMSADGTTLESRDGNFSFSDVVLV